MRMENRLCRMPETIYIIHRKYIHCIATVVIDLLSNMKPLRISQVFGFKNEFENGESICESTKNLRYPKRFHVA